MNKTISYKESTAIAIHAMISAARKDEYADRKRKSGFPQNRKKRDVTLKDVREWNKRRNPYTTQKSHLFTVSRF